MYSFISLWFILELSNLFVYIFDYLFINVLQEDMFFFSFSPFGNTTSEHSKQTYYTNDKQKPFHFSTLHVEQS